MNKGKLLQQVMWAVLVMVLVVGCNAPAATPTSEASPEPVIELGEVIFDGTECTYSGPTELVPGRYSMILRDLSDIDVDIWVGRTTDGKTYQDFMDLAIDPNVYFPKPDFVNYAIEPGRTLLAPDGGAVHTYIFELVGNYFIGRFRFVKIIMFPI